MSTINYTEVLRLAKLGHKAERRREALNGFLTAIVTSLLMSLLKGWLFMVAVGIAHNHWWSSVPTIGFWWSVLFMLVLPSLGGASSNKASS